MYWFLRWIDPRPKRARGRSGAFGITLSLPRSEEAEEVIEAAFQESRRSKCVYVGTQHLLLALIRKSDSVAATVLRHLGIDSRRVLSEVEKLDDVPKVVSTGWSRRRPHRLPVSKRSLKLAVEETSISAEKSVRSEHILLALIRNHDSVAGQVLENLGVTLDRVRDEIQETRRDSGSKGRNNGGRLDSP